MIACVCRSGAPIFSVSNSLVFCFPQYVGMTPNFPAKVIPIQFGKHVDANHALISQGGAYMSQLGDVDVCKFSTVYILDVFFVLPRRLPGN